MPPLFPDISDQPQDWIKPDEEGQLNLDVYRDGGQLVIRSTVAGTKPEDIDVAVNGDLLTIRGKREFGREINEDDWFHRENYWGAFSRSLVLPVDVYPERAEANIKDGVLEIRIPIRGEGGRIKVKEV